MRTFKAAIVFLLITATPILADQEQEKTNKELAIKIMDIFNSKKLSELDDLIAADYIDHTGMKDKKEYIQAVQSYYSAFPDLKATVEDSVSENDKVVLRTTFEGTHKGSFMGVRPTGHTIKWSGIGIFKFKNGKLVERWNASDVFSFLQQIGYKLAPPAPH